MNLRVQIIDDDVRIVEIHRQYVEKTEGFEVVGIANTLEDAQSQLDVLEPDLLLLDIFFPEGNGLEFLKKARLHNKQVDVIPITAAKEVHLFNEALHGGVFDYILKPVVFSRFQATLERYRQTKNQLSSIDQLDQSEVDRALHTVRSGDLHELTELPKGIDRLTLCSHQHAHHDPCRYASTGCARRRWNFCALHSFCWYASGRWSGRCAMALQR
jgi:response regulator of citrate/malate metabolism